MRRWLGVKRRAKPGVSSSACGSPMCGSCRHPNAEPTPTRLGRKLRKAAQNRAAYILCRPANAGGPTRRAAAAFARARVRIHAKARAWILAPSRPPKAAWSPGVCVAEQGLAVQLLNQMQNLYGVQHLPAILFGKEQRTRSEPRPQPPSAETKQAGDAHLDGPPGDGTCWKLV